MNRTEGSVEIYATCCHEDHTSAVLTMASLLVGKRTSIAFGMVAAGFSAIGIIACDGGAGSTLPADGFEQFTSSTKGYSIDYPAGWSVKRDQPIRGASDGATTDDFVSPDKKVEVSVQCVALTRPLTVDEFLRNQLYLLRLPIAGFSDVTVEDRRLMVAGKEAPLLDYSFTIEGSTTYVNTALLVQDCGWMITIAAPVDTETYRDLFERMVTSFHPG